MTDAAVYRWPVRCPWCFKWTDAAAKDCPRCGSTSIAPDQDAK